MSPGFTQTNYKYLCKVKMVNYLIQEVGFNLFYLYKFFWKKKKNSETTQVKKKKKKAKRDLPFHIVSMDS